MRKTDALGLFSATHEELDTTPTEKLTATTEQNGSSSDVETQWARCLEIIRDNVSSQVYTIWFEPIRAKSWNGQQLTIEVPSQFFYEWIEQHYASLLQKTVQKVLGAKTKIRYQIVLEEGHKHQSQTTTMHLPGSRGVTAQAPLPFNDNQPKNVAHYPSYFNPRYTFDNFIRGENNQLATSAAMAVADNPGKTRYNPLVIYGPTGLGKTHLVQAIGNRILQRDRSARVLYTSSERFTMEYINAIQANKVSDFTNFYRGVDVIVVDDIQFLGGKERTQDMFFHTFNALHQDGKQVILTSDRQPKDLADVDERLISRFQWGLVADIQPPDFETRMAILQQKSMEEGVELPGDVLEHIARHVVSSVREIEGCLISLLAKVTLDGRELAIDLARDVVRNITNAPSAIEITIEDIKREVSNYYKQDIAKLSAKTRKHEVVLARQMCMFLAKKLTRMSLKSIGAHFGGRDHTTVLHSCQQIMNYIDTDKSVRQDVEILRKSLNR